MPAPRKIDCPEDKAEGLVKGHPYTTDICNADGCSLHIWMGDQAGDKDLAQRLVSRMKRERDVVVATYSDGAPIGFWAHQNVD